tara:strand:- start:1476 stop:1919 length:444 start_codon:yes stop_codon:yes gene_type:complete
MQFSLSPPAVIFTNRPKGATGQTRAFVVSMPQDFPPKMLVHELHHVRQWGMVTLVAAVLLFALAAVVAPISYYAAFLSVGVHGLLYRFSAEYRFRAEAAAYAASYTGEPTELTDYAAALGSSLYSTGRTATECRGAISARIDTGRLF